ncbi:hypothetical protein JCM10213_006256, partial [Rhodosporidiobolus nylandii]
ATSSSMYSSIADQAIFLRLEDDKADYTTTRRHAAAYIRSHPDDFLPFLPSEIDPENMMSQAEFFRSSDTVKKTDGVASPRSVPFRSSCPLP